jgi:CRISPR system Cascade subunit CasD
MNTLFLRLSGPMQAWGTGSRLQIRRTDAYPSKSGVIGLLLCAMGMDRDAAIDAIAPLAELEMGVRIDRPGVLDWDYHTAGAKFGIRKAEGGIKLTATTKEPETLLSRRQYLLDASFLVALRGRAEVVANAEAALRNPVWPVFLGRKCCVPTEPIFAGTGERGSLRAALESIPFYADRFMEEGSTVDLDAILEHRPGSPPPKNGRLLHDVPRTLRNPSHGPRWIYPTTVTAPCVTAPKIERMWPNGARVDYTSEQWKGIRRKRLEFDNHLCVFCKAGAEEVHHVTYENAGNEQLEDLRSLCRICHDACTQLEYGGDMREHRIDPADPDQREMILRQIYRLMTSRRLGRRRAILESTRSSAPNFLSDAPG